VASTRLTNLSYLIVVSAQFIALYLCGILLYSQVILYNIWIKTFYYPMMLLTCTTASLEFY